jgi:DNA-3-methyladenine glycosylase II
MYFEYSDDDVAKLSRKDKKLAATIERVGRIERPVDPDIFRSLISSIVGQQISTKAAATVFARLETAVGGAITPDSMSQLTAGEIQTLGMSHRKAAYLKDATDAVVTGTLQINQLTNLNDDEVTAELVKLPGIGIWTAEMLMIFSMQRPNILSYGDLAIRRGMMMLYGHKEMPRERFEKYRKRYSPYGSIASLYLWHIAGGQ